MNLLSKGRAEADCPSRLELETRKEMLSRPKPLAGQRGFGWTFGTIKERIFVAARAAEWDSDRIRSLWAKDRILAVELGIKLTRRAFAQRHAPVEEAGYTILGKKTLQLATRWTSPRDSTAHPMSIEQVAKFIVEDICGLGVVPVPGIKYGPTDRRSLASLGHETRGEVKP